MSTTYDLVLFGSWDTSHVPWESSWAIESRERNKMYQSVSPIPQTIKSLVWCKHCLVVSGFWMNWWNPVVCPWFPVAGSPWKKPWMLGQVLWRPTRTTKAWRADLGLCCGASAWLRETLDLWSEGRRRVVALWKWSGKFGKRQAEKKKIQSEATILWTGFGAGQFWNVLTQTGKTNMTWIPEPTNKRFVTRLGRAMQEWALDTVYWMILSLCLFPEWSHGTRLFKHTFTFAILYLFSG